MKTGQASKGNVKVCDGNRAAAYGVLLSRPNVVAIYPITPQTSLIEYLAKFKADGLLNSEVVEVEGEISSMGVAIGAALAGGRSFTASSSMGLYFMFDTYAMAPLARVPLVIAGATDPYEGSAAQMRALVEQLDLPLQMNTQVCLVFKIGVLVTFLQKRVLLLKLQQTKLPF